MDRNPVPIWYHPSYRLALASAEGATGIDPRRADLVVAYLAAQGLVDPAELRVPEPIGDRELSKVHPAELIADLADPAWLARVFRVDASEVMVDDLGRSIRLATGGTLAAARVALEQRLHALNLLGGFHHAARVRPGYFSPVNDVAVASMALMSEGYRGFIVALDLDAHAPDGLADCLAETHGIWLGAISGPDSGRLPDIDHVVLRSGAGDQEYAEALGSLLERIPPADLAFVIAGGDVLGTDRKGQLGLSLAGTLARDRAVARALARIPTVWLPGGGYGPDAWKVLAGTATLLLTRKPTPVPDEYDALQARFAAIAEDLDAVELGGAPPLGAGDWLGNDVGPWPDRVAGTTPRLLGYYTPSGVQYALGRYGIFQHLERLGYRDLRVVLGQEPRGDYLRVLGTADQVEHVLMECVLARENIAGEIWLYVHWLHLKHPRARFGSETSRLPGQDAPGLGMAHEAGQLLRRTAARLGLAGVALRPAWLHTARAAESMGMRFADAARQVRFEALRHDLAGLSLGDASRAVAEGRVTMNGQPYTWEADLMVLETRPRATTPAAAPAERVRFELGGTREGDD